MEWALSECCGLHSEAIGGSPISGVVCLVEPMTLGDGEKNKATWAVVCCLPSQLKDGIVSNAYVTSEIVKWEGYNILDAFIHSGHFLEVFNPWCIRSVISICSSDQVMNISVTLVMVATVKSICVTCSDKSESFFTDCKCSCTAHLNTDMILYMSNLSLETGALPQTARVEPLRAGGI